MPPGKMAPVKLDTSLSRYVCSVAAPHNTKKRMAALVRRNNTSKKGMSTTRIVRAICSTPSSYHKRLPVERGARRSTELFCNTSVQFNNVARIGRRIVDFWI